MTPRRLLPLLCLALACGDDDAAAPEVASACTQAEPVQLIAGHHRWLQVQRAGDTTYVTLRSEDGSQTTHAGVACGADPVLIADGARLLPTPIALDPRDDDPTLVCDQDTNRIYRVDLTGERNPELLLPHLVCPGRPTKYGALFAGGSGYLRLFDEFPDESTATPIREQGGNDLLVLDEWILYTHSSDLHAYAFATGETFAIFGKVLGILGSGDHILWFDYEDIKTATLFDLRARTSTILGTFDYAAARDADQSIPDFSHWTWDFDPSGRYIYHIPPDAPPEAFDLTGRRVALPAPGEIIRLLDGGVVSVTREDGQVHFTRPEDEAATALDAVLGEDEDGWVLKPALDHLERVVDGDLVGIDLDGAPARVLATGVGRVNHWLPGRILLTVHKDGTLERVDADTGERTALADHVIHWQLLGEELYILTAGSADPASDGLWYLSTAALGVADHALEAVRANSSTAVLINTLSRGGGERPRAGR